jgi:hypothetical protein
MFIRDFRGYASLSSEKTPKPPQKCAFSPQFQRFARALGKAGIWPEPCSVPYMLLSAEQSRPGEVFVKLFEMLIFQAGCGVAQGCSESGFFVANSIVTTATRLAPRIISGQSTASCQGFVPIFAVFPI